MCICGLCTYLGNLHTLADLTLSHLSLMLSGPLRGLIHASHKTNPHPNPSAIIHPSFYKTYRCFEASLILLLVHFQNLLKTSVCGTPSRSLLLFPPVVMENSMSTEPGCQWLGPVILATQEADRAQVDQVGSQPG
jgi:disulfide bond formation protein DsbB